MSYKQVCFFATFCIKPEAIQTITHAGLCLAIHILFYNPQISIFRKAGALYVKDTLGGVLLGGYSKILVNRMAKLCRQRNIAYNKLAKISGFNQYSVRRYQRPQGGGFASHRARLQHDISRVPGF